MTTTAQLAGDVKLVVFDLDETFWRGTLSEEGIEFVPAHLALYGAYGLKSPAALNGPQFLNGSILKEPFEVKNGELTVPAGHGLGIEVDEAKLRELIVTDV